MLNQYCAQIQQILFHDAGHAWIYLSLAFLLSTLFLQYLLTGSVKKTSKRISSKNLKSIHSLYLFRSLSGWFFYLVAMGLFLLFWYAYYFKTFELQELALFFAGGSVIAFLLSIIFHLGAYANSCLDQIKKLEDQQLTP